MTHSLILLTLAVSAAFGQENISKQEPLPSEPPSASLYIAGAELKIGMKKAEALSKLGGLTGHQLRPEVNMSGELYLLRIMRGDSNVALIFFKDGVVSKIFRTDHDYFSAETTTAFKDLWEALHAINEDENQTTATVTTRVKTLTTNDPPNTLFDIWISFPNGKVVHISWFSTSGASIEQQLFPRP